MAEPPATTLPAAATAERDVLLATKLHLPRTRPGFVARPRLADRLAEVRGGELVLVCAPAGFGKTALVADWARHSEQPVAWLSLDEADNDPARFWRHAVAALDRVHPGVAERVAGLLGPLPPRSWEALVTALVNELAGVAEEVALVVDDYHLIQAPAIHASVGFVLEHLPVSLRLVLASRADPPLPLARLRVSGQLTEVRAADLRFTLEEAAELLGAAIGPDLPLSAVAALETRTEGWAAGLQLAALSLRGHGDINGFVAGFSGSHRHVLDYLTEEVLARQPEPLRRFLLETSVLERLSGPLCDAVTGRTDSQGLLEQIERANLFLHPLDEARGWWRYHHLFADLLRVRLEQEQPERPAELHHKAAAWCDAHGLPDDAVRHALGAGNTVQAARLVERYVDELVLRGEGATLQRWLTALPAELVDSRPRLLLAQARMAFLAGDVDSVQGPLTAAERAFADAAEEPFEPSVGTAASLSANIPATIALDRAFLAELRGDPDATAAFASRALAQLGEGELMLASFGRWHLAVAEWLHGHLPEAERAFASITSEWSVSEPTVAAWSSQHLGRIQIAQGRLRAALATYHRALELTAAPGRPTLPAAGIAHVGMAEVAYQRGELDSALRHATEGIALCRQLAYTPPVSLATGLAVLAWIRQTQGDRAGALDAMREAERVELSPAVVGLFNPVPALRVRLALAHGEVADAARWVKARGLAEEDAPSYPRECEYLVLARVLLAEQAPERALALLERCHALAAAQGRTGDVIELLALQALAYAAYGDEQRALAALDEALTLGAPEGYLSVFVDEGPPMAALLRKLLSGRRREQVAGASAPRDYLTGLVTAFERLDLAVLPPARRGAVVVTGLIEPLTAREVEVLELLAAGKPNRAIAEDLVVTLETVKKHVSHIFDKLGAANRTQAVTRARGLGLLP
jgi:LuxR family maltose regulon positive regulatory protein